VVGPVVDGPRRRPVDMIGNRPSGFGERSQWVTTEALGLPS